MYQIAKNVTVCYFDSSQNIQKLYVLLDGPSDLAKGTFGLKCFMNLFDLNIQNLF